MDKREILRQTLRADAGCNDNAKKETPDSIVINIYLPLALILVQLNQVAMAI